MHYRDNFWLITVTKGIPVQIMQYKYYSHFCFTMSLNVPCMAEGSGAGETT